MPANVGLILKRHDHAKEQRRTFDWHWQEVADLVLPTRQFTSFQTPGSQQRNRIFDSTAPNANETLSAALHGLLSNPAIRWMELTLEDYEDATDYENVTWLYDSTSRMLSSFASTRSNFATGSHELYLDLGGFGTGVMMLWETATEFRFLPKNLAGFYVIEGDNGEITDNFRNFELSAREVMETFGEDMPGPSDRVRRMASEPGTAETKIELLHAVTKRPGTYSSQKFNTQMPWASCYVELATKHLIREGGFRESPYLMPRWSKAADEWYGRGPGMNVLPSIKGANAIRRDTLIASEQAVRPPVNVFANSIEGPINTRPGSINYVRSGTRDLPVPMQLGTQPQLGQKTLEDVRLEIEEAFFLDVLKLPQVDRMTREEVITRRQQGLLKASPIISRIISEWLSPAVRRYFYWHLRTGRFAPMPASLARKRIKVDYTSPMAQSQKAAGNQNISEAIFTAAPLVQADPSVMMNLDSDATFRTIWTSSGADPRLLRPPRDAQRLRDQQRQQQGMAQQAMMAKDMAAAGKDAASAQREFQGG